MDNEKRARFLSSNDNNDPKIVNVKFLELRLQSHQNVNSTIFTSITRFFPFLGHDHNFISISSSTLFCSIVYNCTEREAKRKGSNEEKNIL